MPFDMTNIDSWSDEEVASFKRKAQKPQLAGPQLEMLGAGGPGTLVAEGDSWFDYPVAIDIIDCLRNVHGFRIESHAHFGDTLENMIFGTGVTSLLQAVRENRPKALLFSGGGNDVAGDEFGGYLNHKLSGLPLVRPDVASYLIDTVFENYLRHLIQAVAEASPTTAIVAHGYGHTKPTGKAVIRIPGFSFLGPWLLPALQAKQIFDAGEQTQCVFTLIDRYNDMLLRLSTQFPQFHYVDLRQLINADTDWANELHLKNSAYLRVSARIAQVIHSL